MMGGRNGAKRFNVKGLTSFVLTLSFLIVAFGGVILYMTPKGCVAHWTGWTMLGLSKDQWSALHINGALLLLVATVIHLAFNWRTFWSYIHRKTVAGLNLKWELLVSVLLPAVLVFGTLYEVPPFSTIVKLNSEIKARWERTAPRGIPAHAEEFTVAEFAATIGLTPDQVIAALADADFAVSDPQSRLADVAEANSVSPNDLYQAILKRFPEAKARGRRGGGAGFGGGRGMGGRRNQGRGGGLR